MNWLRQLVSRRRAYGDLSEEIREHIDEKVEQLVALGMSRLRHGAKMALVGIAIGIGAAFGLMQLMTNLLFGVRPNDPTTFAAVAALLILVALLACYLPARRATRVDPIVALRYE
jgi:predicted lysophospholipase L1 biosynthesis ABC-type transport system permease subunit